VLWAERALRAADVLHWLQKAVAQHGPPEYLRSDNGSEFIAKIVQRWLAANQIKTTVAVTTHNAADARVAAEPHN